MATYEPLRDPLVTYSPEAGLERAARDLSELSLRRGALYSRTHYDCCHPYPADNYRNEG